MHKKWSHCKRQSEHACIPEDMMTCGTGGGGGGRFPRDNDRSSEGAEADGCEKLVGKLATVVLGNEDNTSVGEAGGVGGLCGAAGGKFREMAGVGGSASTVAGIVSGGVGAKGMAK